MTSQARQTHQNRVVILRRSDARRAEGAGIAQPKNPVDATMFVPAVRIIPPGFIRSPASHGILHCASARRFRPRRRSVQDDTFF